MINEIIKKYSDGKATLEETNKALKEAGANFHLDPDGAVAGWSEAEMKEGFMPGGAPKKVQKELDTSRRMDLAGQTVVQSVMGVEYAVSYNDQGYFFRASKMKD